MQVTNSKTDGGDDEEGNDDDDEVEENSMGNQGWSDMILPTIKITGGTPEVRSDKSLTLLTFDFFYIQTMDQWTNGPMVKWSNGPMDHGNNRAMD